MNLIAMDGERNVALMEVDPFREAPRQRFFSPVYLKSLKEGEEESG